MILFFSDLHINETAQFSVATENGFTIRQMMAIQCCQDIVDMLQNPEYDIEAVVFGGDMINKVGNNISTSDLACMTKCIIMIQQECIKRGITFYIIPGNHDCCFSTDTEILTEHGWKKHNECKNIKLAQVNLQTNKITYDFPIRKIFKKNQKVVYGCGAYTSFCTTNDHDFIYQNQKEKILLTRNKIVPRDFSHFSYHDECVEIEDNMLRLITWVITDGCIVFEKIKYKNGISKEKFKRIQWHFVKERKINDLIELLNKTKIRYTLRKTNSNKKDVFINIFTNNAKNIMNYINKEKKYPDFFRNLSKRQFDIVLDTIKQTDGFVTKNNSIAFTSIREEDVDIIQEAAIKNGYMTKKILKDNSRGYNKNGKLFWLFIKEKDQNNVALMKPIKLEEKISDVFCFTMPYGTLITRHNGYVTIMGNCSNDGTFHKLIPFKSYQNVEIIDTFKEIGDYVFMPYAYDDDMANEFLENIEDKENKIVFSHLELKDVPLGNGLLSSHGASINTLKKFKMTLQGHYHTPQTIAPNIIVSGSCHKTSFKDPGGGSMLLYDRETNKCARKYFTVPSWYTFDDDNIDEIKDLDPNNYVKLVISSEAILKFHGITKEFLKKFKGAETVIDVQKISLKRKMASQESLEQETEEDILHRFIELAKVPEDDKQALTELGLDLIARARK